MGYLLYMMAIIPPQYLYPVTQFAKYLGMVLASWGVILIIASFRQISLSAFLGLRKESDTGLVTTGLHAHMRHPIYTGTILLFLGMFISVPSLSVLTATIAVFLYLPLGIYWEEQKLIDTYGEEYLEYKKSVKAIVPRIL